MPLLTRRLLLREFVETDFEALREIESDPEILRYRSRSEITPAATREFINNAKAQAAEQPRQQYALGAVLKDSLRLIGELGLTISSSKYDEAYLWYSINRKYWGQGYGTEAAARLLRFGFEEASLRRIFAECHPDNLASARVLEKIGLKRETTASPERLRFGLSLPPTINPPTPYPDLNTVLSELVTAVRKALGETFLGACLQGSFAVGDFDRDSDVDFIIVIAQALTAEQMFALQYVHGRLFELESAWAQHLEGSYFPRDMLRRPAASKQLLWYLDNGSRALVQSAHDDTLVVRAVMREHGVPLAGLDPATWVDPVPVDELRQEIRAEMTRWWQEIQADPERINNHFYQAYAVLNYCRMLHDLRMGRVGSKRAGAEWVKANLDPAWTGLIDRAWSGRPKPEITSRTRADPDELRQTLAFVRYIVGQL